MKLTTLLHQKKVAILKSWFSLITETYPPDFSKFLKSENDRFANPIGYTVLTGTEILFDEIIHGSNTDRIIPALDSIVRIRAVQDFTPSQAIGFVFFLKEAVREVLKETLEKPSTEEGREIQGELLQFEREVDDLASLALDVYAKCRDDIDRIKFGEANAHVTTNVGIKKK
jgi:hypothetical protein